MPATQGECYLKFIRTINEATEKLTQNGHTFKLRALLWHQGESDSKSSAERHRERLTKLIARIREDTETPNLPVILGEVYDNGNRDNVRTAIQLIAKDDASCGLVVSEGTSTWDEGTHFDAKSQLLLGGRFAEEAMKFYALEKNK